MEGEAAIACPDENVLLDFVAGVLGAGRQAELQHHVAACSACGVLVADLVTSGVTARSGSAGAGHVDAHGNLAVFEPCDRERFSIRREVARGGMGRIVEAWDHRHARKVALKLMIRSDNSAIRARFAREAFVTARLQHPGMVAMYEAGKWGDDEPFLVMKLVAGEPLDASVRAATRLEERLALLPHVVAMTDALAYAHEQGIIHRDLKPSNVLVGSFGETVVIDWGLAKIANESDPDVRSDLLPPSEETLTQDGAALGTPAYMPPEQARGEAVDARADVYALGALLYHVLSGNPPYAPGSSRATLDRVLAGPPQSLAGRAPDVPRDLATIVAKAMARSPAERYPDAGAMAADLRRFVNGQLVAAHAYSPALLLRRWMVRHRGVLATAGVLLAALAVISLVSIRRIVRERDRADALKVVASTQRDAAEKMVGFVIGELRERLEALGKLDLLAGVGVEVGDYYRALGSNDGDPSAPRLGRRGLALLTLVDVDAKTRNYDSAVRLARSAVDVLVEAHRRAPDDVEYASLAVVARGTLTQTLYKAGKSDDAMTEAVLGGTAAMDLVSIGPSDPRPWLAAAFAQSQSGIALAERAELADIDAARLARTRALDDIAHASEREGLGLLWQDLLGLTYQDMSGVGIRTQDWESAVADCKAAVAHRRKQLLPSPHHRGHLNALATALRYEGFAEEKLGRADDALVHIHESVDLFTTVSGLEPNDMTALYDLEIALSVACDFERAWRGPQSAEESCLASEATSKQMRAARPDDGAVENTSGHAIRSLGRALLGEHRYKDAMARFDEAIDLARRSSARDPGSFLRAVGVTQGLSGRAATELAMGRLDAARVDALQMIALDEAQRDAHPNVGFFDEDLGDRYGTLADVELARGDREAARRAYTEAFTLLERSVAADPKDIEAAVLLAQVYVRASAVAPDAAARAKWETRARELTGPLEEAGRLSPEQRNDLRPAHR